MICFLSFFVSVFWSLGWKCSVGSLLLPWMEFPHLSSPSHSHLLSGNNMCGLCQAGGSNCSFPYCCCSYVNSSEPPHTPYLETCSLVASRNSQNYSPAPCSLSKKVLSRSPACPLFKRFLPPPVWYSPATFTLPLSLPSLPMQPRPLVHSHYSHHPLGFQVIACLLSNRASVYQSKVSLNLSTNCLNPLTIHSFTANSTNLSAVVRVCSLGPLFAIIQHCCCVDCLYSDEHVKSLCCVNLVFISSLCAAMHNIQKALWRGKQACQYTLLVPLCFQLTTSAAHAVMRVNKY